jgi:phytanoyl-CoA hydroxylase
LGRIAAHPRLVPLLDQLLGPEARMIQDIALLKPPFLGSEKPWHQDAAYFDWAPLEGVLGVWLALDPATVDDGCVQIIPGSLLAGPVSHHRARDCQIPDS